MPMNSSRWQASCGTNCEKAGNYVVPVASVKKTEEIEKLARRIRGRLKA